jgi:hypothetical protein
MKIHEGLEHFSNFIWLEIQQINLWFETIFEGLVSKTILLFDISSFYKI